MTDALLAPLLSLVEWLAGSLPDGQVPTLSDPGPVVEAIAGVNSLLPVHEVLSLALWLLGCGLAFLLIRLVLVVWNLVWP